jgi:hypothetical protein
MSSSKDRNRILPLDPNSASGKTKQMFDEMRATFGMVPNLFRVLGNAPAALEAYVNFSSAWHSRLQLRADLNDFFASRDHCPRYPLARNKEFREISGARDFPQCHKRLCVRKIHAATWHCDC